MTGFAILTYIHIAMGCWSLMVETDGHAIADKSDEMGNSSLIGVIVDGISVDAFQMKASDHLCHTSRILELLLKLAILRKPLG
jgi:hypothetical protein